MLRVLLFENQLTPPHLNFCPSSATGRRLRQRAPDAGASHRPAGQPVRKGGDEHGLHLRLHASPAHWVCQVAQVQAHRTREGRWDLHGVHCMPCTGPTPGLHDGLYGEACRQLRTVHPATTVHPRGGQGNSRQRGGCAEEGWEHGRLAQNLTVYNLMQLRKWEEFSWSQRFLELVPKLLQVQTK